MTFCRKGYFDMIAYKKLAAQCAVRVRHTCMLGALLMWSSVFLAALPAQAHARDGAQSAARDLENCSWNRPGADPFMGDVVAAVDRYTDIAAPVREQLKQRMRARQYDEMVVITRDAIRGKQQQYDTRIEQMHFGQGRVCRNVTRAGWSEKMEERGLVYCVQGACILVPTICRNVSRITQASGGAPGGAGAAGPAIPAGAAAPGEARTAGVAPIGAADEGTPVLDNRDAARGGMSIGGALPSTVAFRPPASREPVRLASNTPTYAGSSGGGGGGGGVIIGGSSGGGNGGVQIPQGTDGSSFVEDHPVVTVLPDTGLSTVPAVPEPQTWAMLFAGLALIAGSALRRRKQA